MYVHHPYVSPPARTGTHAHVSASLPSRLSGHAVSLPSCVLWRLLRLTLALDPCYSAAWLAASHEAGPWQSWAHHFQSRPTPFHPDSGHLRVFLDYRKMPRNHGWMGLSANVHRMLPRGGEVREALVRDSPYPNSFVLYGGFEVKVNVYFGSSA